MKQNFDRALRFVLAHECVFEHGRYGDYAHVICENVAGDSGGVTKFGIDQASHPHVNIRALTYDQARRIYHDEEWTKLRCDELPAGYDISVFDIAVNNGMHTAATMLQTALNASLAHVPALKVDGFIGAKTIGAAERAGFDGLERLLSIREQRYRDLGEIPSKAKFLRGWLNRNHDLAQLVRGPTATAA